MTIVTLGNIRKRFPVQQGALRQTERYVRAVDGVSLEIKKGETFGLVGESGSGKTTLGKILLGIIKPDSGSVEVATGKIQVVFQDPYNSLDPKMRVSNIIAEGLFLTWSTASVDQADHGQPTRLTMVSVNKKIEDVINLVGLPTSALDKYPHQFSGGERQRIAIARAVITEPEFIVCDEPVSSLDITIQLQILNLLKDIRKRLAVTYLFISHDLRVVRFMCDRVAVMKEGRIVEEGPTQNIYKDPSHPYTKLLLSSVLNAYHKS